MENKYFCLNGHECAYIDSKTRTELEIVRLCCLLRR